MGVDIRIPQKAAVPLTLKETTVSTADLTVEAYLVPWNGSIESRVLVGSTSGALAGTDISFVLDFSPAALTPGTYRLEIVANRTATNPIPLLPNAQKPLYLVEIFDVIVVPE